MFFLSVSRKYSYLDLNGEKQIKKPPDLVKTLWFSLLAWSLRAGNKKANFEDLYSVLFSCQISFSLCSVYSLLALLFYWSMSNRLQMFSCAPPIAPLYITWTSFSVVMVWAGENGRALPVTTPQERATPLSHPLLLLSQCLAFIFGSCCSARAQSSGKASATNVGSGNVGFHFPVWRSSTHSGLCQ